MTDFEESPDYRRLANEFFQFLRGVHSRYGFTDDWMALATGLGAVVELGDRDLYTDAPGRPTIILDRAKTGGRRNFTFAHEIAHHLFASTDEAFRSVLEDALRHQPPELRSQAEEAICYEAASILMFPDHIVSDLVASRLLGPQSVFDLAEARGGSLSAATVRIVSSIHTKLWGYVVDLEGFVEFSWSSSKYKPGTGFRIDPSHLLLEAREAPIEGRAKLLFKNRPGWPVEMKAASNGRRIVGLFADPFPVMPNANQPGLFDSV